MLGDFADFLPLYELLPYLRFTDEEIARYAELGKGGWARYREGDKVGAETAFRVQLAIFDGNPEPYVSLALLAAARGSRDDAVDFLRRAVVRGFTDLRRVDRAEVWEPIRGYGRYQDLLDALPGLTLYEREWAGWDASRTRRAPDSLDQALAEHSRALAGIERMTPVLGPRLARLWKRLLAREAGFRLEAYVAWKRDAPDLAGALERLMQLYAGGPMLRWGRLPVAAATRMDRVSRTVLERFPDSPMRPNALVGRAIAANVRRDKRGRLVEGAAETIRSSLAEVLERHPDSEVAATAAVGLIRVEEDQGRRSEAVTLYRRLSDAGGDGRLVENVREQLGDLALQLGGLPAFRATALDGSIVDGQGLLGTVTVVDFWATWCAPCLDAFPTLRRIHERYGDEVRLVGVNLDSAEDLARDELGAWVASRELPGEQLHDGLSWDSELVRSFGVREIPFNVVIGADGTVLAVNEHGKRLEKIVTAAVRERVD